MHTQTELYMTVSAGSTHTRTELYMTASAGNMHTRTELFYILYMTLSAGNMHHDHLFLFFSLSLQTVGLKSVFSARALSWAWVKTEIPISLSHFLQSSVAELFYISWPYRFFLICLWRGYRWNTILLYFYVALLYFTFFTLLYSTQLYFTFL